MPEAVLHPSLVTCPRCAHEFELTDAVAQKMRGEMAREFEERRRASEGAMAERERALKERQQTLEEKAQSLDTEVAKRLTAERQRLLTEAARAEREKLGTEFRDLQNQLTEQRVKLDAAQKTELDLRKQQRLLEEQSRQLELEVARKLDAERGRIATEARTQAAEEHRLKLSEKEQLITGLQTQIEALKQRAEQGSMQLQGEVLEVELEQTLRTEFLADAIEPVAKGVRGADVLQRIRTPQGGDCGAILWETKRTKNWAREWPSKLREDQREAHAEIAVLVSRALPDGVKHFAYHDGVWVCDFASALPLAVALRQGLVLAAVARQAQAGRQGKMEQVYEYLSGHEFRHGIEAIVESFVVMQTDLEAEKRAMEKQWAKRERAIRQVIGNTATLYGNIQGIVGQAALPEIKALELPPG